MDTGAVLVDNADRAAAASGVNDVEITYKRNVE